MRGFETYLLFYYNNLYKISMKYALGKAESNNRNLYRLEIGVLTLFIFNICL
jgi:hypothetical protein